MEQGVETVILLDTYEELLTETQVKILRMRFDEDLSLGEIGEICNISRQAVRNAIMKAEEKLAFYEKTLGVAEKELKLKKIISLMEKENADKKYVAMLKQLTEET